jgi:hypothetical protein
VANFFPGTINFGRGRGEQWIIKCKKLDLLTFFLIASLNRSYDENYEGGSKLFLQAAIKFSPYL